MAQFDPTDKKLTSGFVVGGETVYIEAAKISTDTYGVAESWPASIDSANSGFVPTISAVKSEIDNKIAGVYQIKGTETLDTMLGESFTGKSNGYVYNVALGTGETAAKKVPAAQSYNGEEFAVNNGDNLVWVKDAGEGGHEGWDKLAASLDMSDVATTAWVNDGTTGSLPARYIASAYTTSGAMTGTGSAASALVSNAGIQDYVGGYISDNTLKTSTALSGITAEGSTDGNKLVGASAITGYIADQLAGTNAYGQIIVNNDTTSASQPNDVFKVQNGNGVTLTTDTDGAGNPTIIFNSNIGIDGVAGADAETSAALTVTPTTGTTDGKVNYNISIPDATTEKVGVVKADYYEESTGLIHLF